MCWRKLALLVLALSATGKRTLQRAFTGNAPFGVHFLCRLKPVLPGGAPSSLGAHTLVCILCRLKPALPVGTPCGGCWERTLQCALPSPSAGKIFAPVGATRLVAHRAKHHCVPPCRAGSTHFSEHCCWRKPAFPVFADESQRSRYASANEGASAGTDFKLSRAVCCWNSRA